MKFNSRNGERGFRKEGGDKKLSFDIAKKSEGELVFTDFSHTEKGKIRTLKEYAEQWTETCVKGARKTSKHRRCRKVPTKYIYPDLGVSPVDKMRRGKFWICCSKS